MPTLTMSLNWHIRNNECMNAHTHTHTYVRTHTSNIFARKVRWLFTVLSTRSIPGVENQCSCTLKGSFLNADFQV